MTDVHESHHLRWGADALWQALEPLLPGLSVEVVASVDSTNTRLLERARDAIGARAGRQPRDSRRADASPPNAAAVPARTAKPATADRRAADLQPCLLVAEQQTHGRGRMGREWHASPGASLTFSLSLLYDPPAWDGLSLAVGVAVADALDPLDDARGDGGAQPLPRVGLKWPNDLWLNDPTGRSGKLGGVLIETLSVGAQRLCVVGVGLNLLPQPDDGPSAGAACLQQIEPGVSAPAVLARIVVPLVRTLLAFEDAAGASAFGSAAASPFAAFRTPFARRDVLHGRQVHSTTPDGPAGVALGVDEDGALRVATADDRVHRLTVGEVSVRLGARALQAVPPTPEAPAC